MDEHELQEIADRYAQMSESELMPLARRYDDLIEPAQAALRAEFERRGIEPPLLDDEPSDNIGTDPHLVTVARYRDMPEAFVARSVLEAAGIECVLRDEYTVRMDWLLSNVIGGMRLQVAAKDEAFAKDLLSKPLPEDLVTQSGPEFGDPVCPRCGATNVELYDPSRKATAASLASAFFLGLPLPYWRVRINGAWRCSQCGCTWIEDDETVESVEKG